MTETVNVRELALAVLLDVTSGTEYSHIALSGVLDKYQYLEKRERAFLTREVEGTLENLIRIDYIIGQCSKVPISRMKPVIRTILRMGVYELCYMDTVPASATCNEMVKLAGRKGFHGLKGFVNGVLRAIYRLMEQDALSWPDEKKEPVKALSVKTSIPEWILKQWECDYGWERTTQIAAALSAQSPLTVRRNRNLITTDELEKCWQSENVTFTKTEAFSDAYYLSGIDRLQALDSFQKGYFYVQDISSMQVAELALAEYKDADSTAADTTPANMDFVPEPLVLDLCGAPGGKALHAAEILQACGHGHVITRDISKYKVDLINENIARCHAKNIEAQVWDARKSDTSLIGKADIVFCDLPCSGLGIMAKKKEIRYRMTENQERELAKLQREILTVGAEYVKSGGTLMYSTCTIDCKENEQNSAWFLENHPEFSMELQRQIFPEAGKMDGFYIAKFKKTSNI